MSRYFQSVQISINLCENSKKSSLAFFKSAVSLCSLEKQVHAMNDIACFTIHVRKTNKNIYVILLVQALKKSADREL